ncbi:two-component system regulatory protein YycI, partial [Staphylococcus epidermidis]|uniref:two-component system regulatory protein YycI n=1 Tax=Staphylococcus epidermidis TaxID=1282 RepID=UPI0037D9EDD4
MFLLILYIHKLNKSQLNHSQNLNHLNFQQQQIHLPNHLFNQTLKHTQLQQITPPSKNFSTYPKHHSTLQTSHSHKTLQPHIHKPLQLTHNNLQHIKHYIPNKIFNPKHYQLTHLTKHKLTYQQTYKHYPI